jgi:hypothetical protein
MSVVDEKIDSAANKLEELSRQNASEPGLKGKLGAQLEEEAEFLRKLKPSLIKARAKGELPTNEPPGATRSAPAGPQLGRRPKPTPKRGGGGGPNPWLVAGVALAAGIALAKWIDWRGHAHPRG